MPNRSMLAFALLFQATLIPVALLLGWILGVDPLEALRGDWRAWVIGLIATAPMVALFIGLLQTRAEWARAIHERLRMVLPPLFSSSPWLGVLAASVFAGVGEEMLFRGVLQEAIAQGTTPVTGLVIASVIFGLLHWITPAYALLATGLGFYLGGLYMLTGTLIVPIVAHAVYDFFALRYYLTHFEDSDEETLTAKPTTNGAPPASSPDAGEET